MWVPRHTTPLTHTDFFVRVFACWRVAWCGHLHNHLASSFWLCRHYQQSLFLNKCDIKHEGYLGSTPNGVQAGFCLPAT